MSYEILAINIASALFGSLLILFFLNNVYEIKIKLKDKFVFVFIFSLLNGYVSTKMASSAFKPIVLIILSILFIRILLKVSTLQSFISFALYSIGVAAGDALNTTIVSYIANEILIESIQKNIVFPILGNIIANAFACFLFILLKPFKNYIKVINRNKYLYVLITFTIVVIVSSFALHYYMNIFNFTAYVIIAIITISYCIFIVLVLLFTLRKTIIEEEIAQQKFYNESLRSTLFELRRFKHDWGNNLTVINSMLKMNKINELKNYVTELITQNAEHGGTEIFNIKNAGLFGIISSKISLAREKGINVELDVIGEIENIPGIKISELCEIIGIFLDNAIDEAEKACEKTIEIMLKDNMSIIEISISNECAESPDIQSIFREGYSTKGDNRGMGLAIVKKIISKYKNILLTTNFEENTFTQTLEILKGKGP